MLEGGTLYPTVGHSMDAACGMFECRHWGEGVCFGGRGGKDMAALPSDVFELNTSAREWKVFAHGREGEVPEARSYLPVRYIID
jgi:Galactose oxidase, central domain